jgi:hypothetical protein
MTQTSGFIIYLPNEEEKFRHCLIKNKPFTGIATFLMNEKSGIIRLLFISFDNKHIHYAVLLKTGNKNHQLTEPKRNLKFFKSLNIQPPILLNEIYENSTFLNISLNSFKCLPAWKNENSYMYEINSPYWEQLINCIKKLRENIARDLDEMLELVNNTNILEGEDSNRMAQQKDAVQVCLNLVFGDTDLLSEKYFKSTTDFQNRDYLSYVIEDDISDFIEDDIIYNDSLIFDDWHIDKNNSNLVQRTFKRGKNILKITNVNRKKAEKSLGVDLIYFNHKFKSFVMVQYKTWKQESKKNIYRYDDGYEKQITRMKTADKILFRKHIFTKITSTSYRIDPNPFYFKICYPENISYNQHMIGGIYLPYLYAEICMNECSGKQGGKLIREEDIPYKIHNNLFIELVKSGLIGSRGINNHTELKTVINDLLESGHRITIAEHYED